MQDSDFWVGGLHSEGLGNRGNKLGERWTNSIPFCSVKVNARHAVPGWLPELCPASEPAGVESQSERRLFMPRRIETTFRWLVDE